jgi:hypothetical protein
MDKLEKSGNPIDIEKLEFFIDTTVRIIEEKNKK